MASINRHIKTYRNFAKSPEQLGLRVFPTINSSLISKAQLLHASVYLRNKFILPHEVDASGRMPISQDPYQLHSSYFVVADRTPAQRILATARQINADQNNGFNSFPVLKNMEIYPESLQVLYAYEPTQCVEISGLAKAKGMTSAAVMLLYRTMWQYSLRKQHRIWLMACDARLFSNLQNLFGDSLVRIGENSFYMGSEVVPAMLEVAQSVDRLMEETKSPNLLKSILKKRMVNFFIEGLPVKYTKLQKVQSKPSKEILKAIKEEK